MREAMVSVLSLVAKYESELPREFIHAAMDLGAEINRYLLNSSVADSPCRERPGPQRMENETAIATPSFPLKASSRFALPTGTSRCHENVDEGCCNAILPLSRSPGPATSQELGCDARLKALQLVLDRRTTYSAFLSRWTAQVEANIQRREKLVERLRNWVPPDVTAGCP